MSIYSWYHLIIQIWISQIPRCTLALFDFLVLQSVLRSSDSFSFMYRSLSNMMISSTCLPLWIWASYSLSLLALALPMQPAKAAPTARNIEPNITRHTLPLSEVPGARIDRSSLTVGAGGVLVHYISSDVDFTTATQAIIVVHGRQRDADRYFASMKGAVEAANKREVVIMAVSTPFLFLRITKLENAYSPFSSMSTIRARFHGRTAWPPPINSCGKASMHHIL